MAKIVSGVAVLIIALLVLFFVFRGDDEADAEAQYDGVHLCSPSQQAAGTAQARARDSVPEALGSGEAPYFAQNSAAWGGEEYDHGGSQNVGCGQTIAQCGCAMTSVATVMHLFEVVTTPGEDPLTPSTLNAWFNQNAQLTSEGWVSAGYVFGNVVWTAINGWTPTAAQEALEDDNGDSERASPDSRAAAEAQVPQGMRFAGWGSGSEEEIRRELEAGRPVVIEVPGHYVAAVALQDSTIVINDPAYRERTTLDAYAGRVLSARLFEPSDDFRSILVSVPSNLRIEVTDEQGRTVGTLEGTDPAEADNNAAAEMPGAVYQFQGMWRDPTCTERPPPDGAGINSVFISFPETGKYTVVVVNPEGGDTAAAVHMSDVKGTQRIEVHEGGSQTTFEIDYDAGADTAPPTTPTPTPTPTATPEDDTPTPTPLPPSVTPQPPTATPTDTPTITPTITPTPTATTVPLDITSFDIVLDEVNQGDPCRILLSWTVTGNPEGTVRLLKQFGTSLNNNTAEVLIEGGPGQGSYIDGFLVGPWTYRVLATSPQQITSDTLTVRPICIRLFSAKGSDAYSVDVSWHIQGEMPGATYTLSRAGCCVLSTGSVNYGTTQTYTDTNFDLGCGPDNPRQYVLSVNVAARTVTTNSITAIAPCPVIF